MVNKVILIGNLGRDPEVRYLEGNVAVAKFSLATNESYKDKKGDWQTVTEWHDIVAWRGLAERAEKQLKKAARFSWKGNSHIANTRIKKVTTGTSRKSLRIVSKFLIAGIPGQVDKTKNFRLKIHTVIHPQHQAPVENNTPMMIFLSDHTGELL